LAKLAHRAGFPMAFVSGYSVSATAIGEPDMGLRTQTELIDRARRICLSVPIPVIVDADNGSGNPLNVHCTVAELVAAGAAGCFLEDQVWPKRCGHMRGKRVIGRDDYVQKVRAAVAARAGRDFFIVARTDALADEGLDEASRGWRRRSSGGISVGNLLSGSRSVSFRTLPAIRAPIGQVTLEGGPADPERPADVSDGVRLVVVQRTGLSLLLRVQLPRPATLLSGARAASSPALVPSRMMSRSNSARAAKT
jgi:methylisocitrate lyase